MQMQEDARLKIFQDGILQMQQIEHVRWQIEDQVGWQIVYMVEWQIEHVRLQGRVGSGDPQHEVDGQDGLMQEKETRFKDKIFSR